MRVAIGSHEQHIGLGQVLAGLFVFTTAALVVALVITVIQGQATVAGNIAIGLFFYVLMTVPPWIAYEAGRRATRRELEELEATVLESVSQLQASVDQLAQQLAAGGRVTPLRRDAR
mgnify:CR=1 FL=1